MFLTFFLCFLQLGTFSEDLSVLEHSESQAKYYISKIENGSNVEENLWALTTLGSENEEIKALVEESSQGKDILSPFTTFEDNFQSQLEKVVFQTGSPNLLIALLLETEETTKKRKLYREFLAKFNLPDLKDISYPKLSEAIINDEEINSDILTDRKFLLPHFFLLWNSNYSTFFTEDYYKNLKENLRSNFTSTSLPSTLERTTYFRLLYVTKDFSQSSSLYDSFIVDKLFPNSSLKLKIYQFFDYTMYQLGSYDRSLNIVRNVTIPLSKYLDRKDKELQFTQLQGVYLYSIGKIQEAEKLYQKVLENIDEENPGVSLSSLYNNLALSYHKLGNYDKYLDLQLQALEYAKENNNYSHQLSVLNNLFIYYRSNNDLKNALLYIEKAQNLAAEENKTEELGRIYTLYGSFYRNFKKDYDTAHKFFSRAEEILKSENNAKYYFDLLIDKAETYERQKNFDKALQTNDQIINKIPEQNNPNHIDAVVNKALINLKIDQLDIADQLINKFKSLELDQLAFQQIIKAKTVEADYLQRTGEYQEALTLLEPALEQIIERAKSSADLESGFWHVEDEYLDAFELTVSIYRETGQDDKAIETLDQLKTVNDASLYQNPLVKSSLLNESELTEYKRLSDQLDATRKKLLTASEDEQFNIRQTINELKLKKRRLDQKLTDQVDSEPTSVREVQRHLSARELVLHITELNDQFYVANISRSDISVKTIPIDSTLSNLLSTSARQIANNETNLDSLYKISQTLNLKEIPDYVEQVTLIPDSDFFQLPIDILPLEKPTHSYSYGGVTYAIEKFRTQYLTSLEDFIADPSEKSRSPNQLNYTGYGVSSFEGYNDQSLVSLPFAQTEISNIANRLTRLANVETFINEQSTKSTFKLTAPESEIIHLATHSEVSDRDPMFSTVYMSNTTSSSDSTFDGQIFAYELFELNLNNEMIMLNSCESGSGSFIQGTGVMGISRALRYAGASSLVLNLWSVNDMLASDFAVYFYDQLNEGKSKAEALRDAKRYFLNSKNASPHFWGPYMLIGNSDPIVEPNRDNNMAMAGIFIIYFLLMAGLSYLTQQGFIFQSQDRKAA